MEVHIEAVSGGATVMGRIVLQSNRLSWRLRD
jgi:hypothetical protein